MKRSIAGVRNWNNHDSNKSDSNCKNSSSQPPQENVCPFDNNVIQLTSSTKDKEEHTLESKFVGEESSIAPHGTAAPAAPTTTADGTMNLPVHSGDDWNHNVDNEKILAKLWALMDDVPLDLMVVIVLWYFVGVASICTTKLLADRGIPPVVLTFQQLLLGSLVLRVYLGVSGELQPLPKSVATKFQGMSLKAKKTDSSSHDVEEVLSPLKLSTARSSKKGTTQSGLIPRDDDLYIHFGLMGIFDGLDFLSTAIAFGLANASFVETVKSSQPITTTAVALFFRIDTLKRSEGLAMAFIVAGVFCSTLGNAQDRNRILDEDDESNLSTSMTMEQSIHTAMIGILANLCFALRVNSQKKFRAHPEGRQMSDTNMLMWMQRMGSIALSIPIMFWELPGVIQRTIDTPFWEELVPFWIFIVINAVCFSLYTLTNTWVLTKVSVGQHTGLNALRRMFVIIFTALAFGVPITPMKSLGIGLCFSGFSAFSYFRNLTEVTTTNPEDSSHQVEPLVRPLADPAAEFGNDHAQPRESVLPLVSVDFEQERESSIPREFV